MRNTGFLPGFATFGHRDVDAFLSCSENEDGSAGQGPSTQRRGAHGLIPSPSYKSLQRAMSLVKDPEGP